MNFGVLGWLWRPACIFALMAFTVAASPAQAGDKPLVGPVPNWAHPAPEPSVNALPKSGKVFPLFDEQALIEGDKVTAYIDVATLISSPEMLNKSGTISFAWQPDHGDLTFHRIDIIRDGEKIDALKGGAGLSVLHREEELERRVVDGKLTAVQHVEGLRVGDMLRVSISISERDPLLRGHIQDELIVLPKPVEIGFGRVRLVWPQDRKITWKVMTPGVTPTLQKIGGDRQELLISMPVAKSPEMPKNYPLRFEPMPTLVFTSFSDWSEVKRVMAPLYGTTNAIAPSSDLAKRIDAIAARSPDPVRRMADALQMVQDDVRYQLVALGAGNYSPQPPAETWAKRYGDCKAKTLLLLAVLERLGITAEPVLANLKRGDTVRNMPPSAIAFDHVFVRAEVNGEAYWLDGTGLGSRLADIHDVPKYGTVLPLFDKNADLIDLPRRANARSDVDVRLTYDMSAGPHFPAPFTIELSYAGAYGAARRIEGGGDEEERLKTFTEKEVKSWTGSDDIGRPAASFDPVQAVWTIRVEGVAYPNWQVEDGHEQLDHTPALLTVLDASREKSAWKSIPALIADPWTAHTLVTMKLPDQGKGVAISGAGDSELLLPAVNWRRRSSLVGGNMIEDIQSRETGVEIPAEQISATRKAISDDMGKAFHVTLPADYPKRWDDAKRMRSSPAMLRVKAIYDERIAQKPEDSSRISDRAWFESRLLDFEAADRDYGKVIALDASAKLYLARASLRSSEGRHPDALKDAQAAYDLEPGNADARAWLSSELSYAGQVDKALDLLNADPDVATDDGISDFNQRIEVSEIGGRFDEAGEALDAQLKKHPKMAKLLNARCYFRALRNAELDGALSDCNLALEMSSDPANYLDSRALVHFRAGRLQAALDDYDAALELDPEFSTSLFMSSVVLSRLGEPAKAAERLRAARTLNPNIDQYFPRFGIKP